MKQITVKCNIKLTDVYDGSWCTEPTLERVIKTLDYTLRRCISDTGTVEIGNVELLNEVIPNADD